MITAKNIEIHLALLKNNLSVKPLLQGITNTNLYYGVDNLAAEIIINTPETSESGAIELLHCMDRLSEAFMTRYLTNPEQHGTKGKNKPTESYEDFERSLSNLEIFTSTKLVFPNPFPSEYGIQSSHGLVSYRAIQSLYQAIQVECIFTRYQLTGGVLEIGGGMGRTAHWLSLFDRHVSIVDLPLGLIGQALYLSQAIGEHALRLPYEPYSPEHKVTLMDPSAFLEDKNLVHHGLALNVDSFVEMNSKMVSSYLNVIHIKKMFLLSINHEVNDFTVGELIEVQNKFKLLYRSPYWMRAGYAEELYKF